MANKGIALILVISILTVVAITVVSFIFSMRLESRAAANYLWQEKAGYLAEAGITHALAVLKEDKQNDAIDTYQDLWSSAFQGDHIDNNDDGQADSRWIEIVSKDGSLIGRYAVLVEDEAAKININTAGFHNESPLKATQGASTFEVSLKDFFLAKNIASSQGVAQAIIDYRYGDDKQPGDKGSDDNQNQVFFSFDGVDNDADGAIDEPREGIDEPQEFVLSFPYGDDRPFLKTEEVKRIKQISTGIYNRIAPGITAYSQTVSIDRNRDLQQDINSIDAQQLLDLLLASGVSSPWQKAVNMVDFADSDFAQSLVRRSTLPLYTTNQGPKGDWLWQQDHYQSKTYGGIQGTWTWMNIEAGEYFLFLHGLQPGQYIGDVTIAGLTQPQMLSGESFNVFPSETITVGDAGSGEGSLTIAIQNNEKLGTTCYFKYIELCSAEGKSHDLTEQVRGAEGLRINELMPQPVIELVVTAEQSPGGDWLWQRGHYENAVSQGGAPGEGSWIWQDIPDGEYYLTVYAASTGQMVGDVYADGVVQENMHSEERFSAQPTVTVSGGVFRLDIQNNLSTGSCYFKSALLSQQPDGEFIEVVNLTDQEVSLGGWSVEASGNAGWPASIPLGTSIDPGKYLVLAVDKDDYCPGLSGNGMSFSDIWGRLPSVQLDFSRSVTAHSDMIEDAPAQGQGEVILRDEQGNIVDRQAYSAAQISAYLSLEKADPTFVGTPEEVWFASEHLSGATPAQENKNAGMIEEREAQIIEHSQREAKVSNHPFPNLGEFTQVSTGKAWEKIGIKDIIAFVDKLTVYSLRLEAEGHYQSGSWMEQLRSSGQSPWFVSNSSGQVGTWVWQEQARIPNGVYSLYLYGESEQSIAVSLRLADNTWTDFSPALTPGANKGVFFGRIEIGTGSPRSLASSNIGMRIKNASASGIAHFDYIRLAPLPYVPGKININTASLEVLQALPKIDRASAQRIIEQRPLGNQGQRGRGIGDLLSGNALGSQVPEKIDKFKAISNLITVRSNSYQITATAQALRNGRVMAEKRIRTIVER